ncbi:MAG: DotU family type IV/VI secretion system protein [Holosporales bacterium]|jgi:type VI secretion system protein ImpK|nr:DotU family type IV/VI secretion system protein [Holosporales bacterium]
MSFDASDSAIVHGFQAFYYELLRYKEKALSRYFENEVQQEQLDENSKERNEVEGVVVEVQKNLLRVIENVSNIMLVKSRVAPKFIDDAKYIMAVFTDEIFLNLKWKGARYWRFTLLEKQIFQTEVAGDKFFSILDEVIVDINNEEMSFLYLMVLSLGFKGRYRGVDNGESQISWYKDRLYSILNSKPARLFFPGRSHMISSCYEYTNTEKGESYLPDARFWSWCITSVVFLYILISYIAWCGITWEIGDVLDQISKQTRQGPLI